MDTQTQTRIGRQRTEDLRRLALKAERSGVRILVDHRTGAHVATSASDPSRCYHVDAERGCSCRGWMAWQRCSHHSLLLAQLGMLPDVTPAFVTCPVCQGSGRDPECSGHQVAGGTVSCPCYRCAGHGTIVPAPQLLAA